VLTRLPAPQAGTFIRQVFPAYYLFVLINAAIAAAALAPLPAAWTMALVAVCTIWLRQWLMPRINTLSDQTKIGDTVAKRRFDRAHLLSVGVNVAQMLLAGGVLWRFALPGGR
jgi:hypothetical protein